MKRADIKVGQVLLANSKARWEERDAFYSKKVKVLDTGHWTVARYGSMTMRQVETEAGPRMLPQFFAQNASGGGILVEFLTDDDLETGAYKVFQPGHLRGDWEEMSAMVAERQERHRLQQIEAERRAVEKAQQTQALRERFAALGITLGPGFHGEFTIAHSQAEKVLEMLEGDPHR